MSLTHSVENSLPSGTMRLENQVAGHTFQEGTDSIGMLKDQHDNSVLKPLTKPICGEREKSFYEMFETTKNPSLLALKRLIPQYKGSVIAEINGRQVEFIKLSDMTHAVQKPCIMDIKIGKRTWDPLATKDKIRVEEEKYAACKKSLGLCLPGFQYYDIETGKLHRFSKDYGKKLNETSFRDTLRMFLNAKSGLCERLVVQILFELKSIQKWMQTQTFYKLYSSSILLVYDAAKLEAILEDNTLNCNVLNGSFLPHSEQCCDPNTVSSEERKWIEDISYCARNEISEENDQNVDQSKSDNCDNELKANGFKNNNTLCIVKMIDFAHVFPTEDDSLDENYLFGINNLVRIFEEFLKECD